MLEMSSPTEAISCLHHSEDAGAAVEHTLHMRFSHCGRVDGEEVEEGRVWSMLGV